MGRWSEPRPGRECHLQWGAREAVANEILGDEDSRWNDRKAWERRGRSGFLDRRKLSSETGHFRAGQER